MNHNKHILLKVHQAARLEETLKANGHFSLIFDSCFFFVFFFRTVVLGLDFLLNAQVFASLFFKNFH